MKESSTYQAILDEGFVKGKRQGRAEGLREGRQEGSLLTKRETLVRIARMRLGEPSATVQLVLEGIASEGLDALIDRVLEAESWQELLEKS